TLAEPKSTEPVHNPEIDDLGPAPGLLPREATLVSENFSGRSFVNVLPFLESFNKNWIPGKVSHDSELNLRIISRQNRKARHGNRGAPDTPAQLAANGNVLQIGITR